jgi:hypothetical protein
MPTRRLFALAPLVVLALPEFGSSVVSMSTVITALNAAAGTPRAFGESLVDVSTRKTTSLASRRFCERSVSGGKHPRTCLPAQRVPLVPDSARAGDWDKAAKTTAAKRNPKRQNLMIISSKYIPKPIRSTHPERSFKSSRLLSWPPWIPGPTPLNGVLRSIRCRLS